MRLTFFEERDWIRGPSPNRLRWFITASLVLHLVLFTALQIWPRMSKSPSKERTPIFVRVLDPSELEQLSPGPETRLPSTPRMAPRMSPRGGEAHAPRAEVKKVPRVPPRVVAIPRAPAKGAPRTAVEPLPIVPPAEPSWAGRPERRGPGASDLPFVETGELERLARVFSYRESPKRDVVSLNTDDLKYASYMYQLKRRVETILQYPESLREHRPPVQGSATVQFIIGKDGRLEDLRLLGSSGSPELDQESLRAIRASFPFLPLPDAWGQNHLIIPARVIFEANYISIY